MIAGESSAGTNSTRILQDNFEDAVDTTSVRSLTGRKTSNTEKTSRLSAGPGDARSRSVSPGTRPSSKVEAVNGDEKAVTESQEDGPQEKPPQLPTRISAASLDNVNLDEAAVDRKGKG
jgi:hypothetical protein